MSQKLYEHPWRFREAQNVNERHAAERLSLNDRIAVFISRNVGTMLCAYLFGLIGIGSLVGVFTNNLLLALICGSLSSYFIQLVLLPIIMVGQNVAGRHSELMADETFKTTQDTYRMLEQLVGHLHAQDAVLLHLRQTQALVLDKLGIETEPTTEGRLPVVRMGERTLVDENELRLDLARYMRPELLERLSPALLLVLKEEYIRHQEPRQ